MQFIETQYPGFASQVLGYPVQRVRNIAECTQSCMHLLHESIEVDAARLHRRQGRVEQIHQECFTATYTTVQVQAGGGCRPRWYTKAKARERRLPPWRSSLRICYCRTQFQQQRIETRNCLHLRRIGHMSRCG